MTNDIIIYYTSVASNMEIRKKQQQIQFILEGKKIEFRLEDVAASRDTKEKMRKLVGDPKALPPQIANGDVYCGDYDAFDAAVGDGEIDRFLKLK